MKAIKLITKILAIMLVTAIAFVGVYVQKQNKMENQVKDYAWGMDIEGSRVIEFKVSDEKEKIIRDKDGKVVKEEDKEENEEYTTEEKPVNSEEVKTLENYKKSKNIIEKRLAELGVNDYITKLDEENGTLIYEMPENEETDHIVSNISEVGKFEIVDSEDTEKILMDNSDIKKVNVMYNNGTSGTTVFLNIEFTKEGAEKLKNISIEYATIEDGEYEEQESSEETENEESTEETKQKEIIMQIDDNKMITTSFSETMENGKLQLTMGQATTDTEKLSDYIESATTIATILDSGNLPIEYEVEGNQFVASDITTDLLIKLAIIEAIIMGIALMILIIKYKGIGILAAIEYIGFISIFLLLIRYTNVILTLEGITAIAVILTLNYIYNSKMLNKLKEVEDKRKVIKDSLIDFIIKAIPIFILSIVFCFISWTPICSFGMTMFWGLALIAIYNLTVTKCFLK